MEDRLTASEGLTVADLVSMFETAEEASQDARKQSERDRDYHDNKQLSAEEKAVLKKRRQPEYIDNRIKTKIDYLVGLEKQQRINPKAQPRTPVHEQDADAATQALTYVADTEQFDYKRSGIWRNLLIEGAGGMSVAVETNHRGEPEIRLRRVAWDRMFWDPHSAEVDFSDAGYLGTVQWMDYDDALRLYPDAKEALDATMSAVAHSDTYDDRPKWNLWADKKRRRVRIVQIWLKKGDEWHFAEFTKGGILKAGPSPYVDDQGRSDCELIFQSSYADRDNNRFGLVRELISLQDAINKRNSKALHALNTVQVVARKGAVDDIERARVEAARPDGWIEVNSINDRLDADFQFTTRSDLAQGQVMLLQEAKNSIDLKGPNATAMGDKAQGAAAASGKAIIASQQGGMVSLGDLLDNLRHLDKRVFRAIWNRIRQFWTAEKWIRVTDDERNVKWVGFNVDPMRQSQISMLPPDKQEMIAGMVGSVAEMDCDITIDEAPDSTVPALEQFEALVNLKQFDVNNELPFRALVVAAPNLKNRDKVLKAMDERQEQNPVQQAAQQIQLASAEAKVRVDQANAGLKEAQTAKTMIEAQLAPAQFAQDQQEAEAARRERFVMKDADLSASADDRRSRENQFQQRAAQAA